MNLAEIASEEQELRGALKRHADLLAIAEKEVESHLAAISEIDARLEELAAAAVARISETRALRPARLNPVRSVGLIYSPQGGVQVDPEAAIIQRAITAEDEEEAAERLFNPDAERAA